MGNLILAILGATVAVIGGAYLAHLMYFKKRGVLVKAEVTDVKEDTRKKGRQINGYIHTMKYEIGGKTNSDLRTIDLL